MPTAPTADHSVPSGSGQSRDPVESDADPHPYLSATARGKRPAKPHVLMSDDESVYAEDEIFRESITPTPHTATEVNRSPIDGSSIPDHTIGS